MKPRHFIKRRDLNHDEVIRDLRMLGFSVIDLHNVGGCPDLLVGGTLVSHNRNLNFPVNLLVEVKSAGGKLSEGQERFFKEWPGPKIVAYSWEDIAKWFGRTL